MSRQILIVVCLIAFFAGCTGKREQPLERYSESKYLMGAMIQVDVCIDRGQQEKVSPVYERIWQRLEEINVRMYEWNPDSELSKINQAYPNTVKVSPDVYLLLQHSKKFSTITSGAFDITVFPLIKLWKEGQNQNSMPTDESLLQALETIGADKIQLGEDNTVRLLHPGTMVGMGGIAAGYAVDEAARIFREAGYKQFYIDISGDMYVGGENCANRPWRLGIRDPRDKTKILDVVELIDAAITTSGDYERFYEIQGERWSHIMDPRTGYPQKGIISSSVIAPTALESDALATAMCVLGPQAGTEMIDGMGGDFASISVAKRKDGDGVEVYTSRNYGKYAVGK